MSGAGLERGKKRSLPSWSSLLGRESEGGERKGPWHLLCAHLHAPNQAGLLATRPTQPTSGQIRTVSATQPTGTGLVKPEAHLILAGFFRKKSTKSKIINTKLA